MKNNFYNNGFTLIELLVVITIIGILSSIVYSSFGGARASARDDVRKSDIKQLQLAVEAYRAQNGRYPEACRGPNVWSGGLPSGTYRCGGSDYNFIVDIVPEYIAALPEDPSQNSLTGGQGYLYRVDSSGSAYKILAHHTVEEDIIESYDDEFARCPASVGVAYCGSAPHPNTYGVYSIGAEDW